MNSLWSVFDIAGKAAEVDHLEAESARPNLWNDPDYAQRVMRRLSRLKSDAAAWNGPLQRLRDAVELAEMDDPNLAGELAQEADNLQQVVARLEFRAKLSGKFDAEDAYLAIHAGAGGTDAQDWAEMLLRMYLRWAERRGFK
ncbi:MAG: PCRF domain-containing protein, partial [Anaerolineae bacterium]|nr:PCRF domain-containing protein [Anaerolineae bacterium]